jgi:hypothetical protein
MLYINLLPLGDHLAGIIFHHWLVPFNFFYPLVIEEFAMENPPIFKNGKPSISMGHGFHGYVK